MFSPSKDFCPLKLSWGRENERKKWEEEKSSKGITVRDTREEKRMRVPSKIPGSVKKNQQEV